jgi:hypothetical protein
MKAEHDIRREAQAAALLRKQLIDAQLIDHDDDEVWAATLEGETDLLELIDRLEEAMQRERPTRSTASSGSGRCSRACSGSSIG